MKKVLTPLRKFLVISFISALITMVIHYNVNSIAHFIIESMSPLLKIFILAIFLMAYGWVMYLGQAIEASFSGTPDEKSKLFWKPLVIESSFKGFFQLFTFLIQIFIFSSLLYPIGAILYRWLRV